MKRGQKVGTEKDKQAALKLLREHMHPSEVAAKFGHTKFWAYNLASAHGIKLKERRGKYIRNHQKV